MQKGGAFTATSSVIANVLMTSVGVHPCFDADGALLKEVKGKTYQAIWDTGASASLISKKVAAELELVPTGMTQVGHAQGVSNVNTYIVGFKLPNNTLINQVTVVEGVLGDADILIGMDILNLGDFAVTNFGGQTRFSFRIPSMGEIDFVKDAQSANGIGLRVGRNDTCPCKSGRKFKHCCGKR